MLFGLFYYINSLVNKEKKLYPLIISNIVMIVLLIATVAAWNFGLVENRNNRINTKSIVLIEEIQDGIDSTQTPGI